MGEYLMQVAALEGYRLWSSHYDETPNPLLALESRVLANFIGETRGRRILDAGCGTGRSMEQLANSGAQVWGVDFCDRMLAIAAGKPGLSNRCLVADIACLPFEDRSFHLALCSLTLSYTTNLRYSLTELARVANSVIVTDLHPEATRRGWTRSFRKDGQSWEIDHQRYTCDELDEAAQSAGLFRICRIEAVFGEPEREIFRLAGKESAFGVMTEHPALLVSSWAHPYD
jgi:SAM-dependent methyltransferase